MAKKGYTYITSYKNRTVPYIGVTSELKKRIWKHKNKVYESFSKRYNVYDLMYYETFDRIIDAIKREKQLKNWKKEWKWDLIKKNNPELKDLYDELT